MLLSCATIKSTDKLIQNVFSLYVEKHRDKFEQQYELTYQKLQNDN